MRPIGFSTGALSLANFHEAIDVLRYEQVNAIELSALRYSELDFLLASLSLLNLEKYSFIGIHAPSAFSEADEVFIASQLIHYVPKKWPIVLHPDSIYDFSIWNEFGDQLAIENMDRRKPIGRTTEELASIFAKLPNASLCFDIGHARQIDMTMTEAYRMLSKYGERLRWVHASEVNSLSRHETLSFASIAAFAEVSYLVPENVPVILEARTPYNAIGLEIEKAMRALPITIQPAKTA